MRLLLLSKYHRDGPSSRYRFFCVADQIRAHGHEVEIFPLFHQGYVTSFYLRGQRWSLKTLNDYWFRWRVMRSQTNWPELTVVEYETFPYLPRVFEMCFLRKLRPWVIDVDDAIEARYQRIPWLRSKMASLFSSADGIVAGNPVLAEQIGHYNQRVLCIPTGIAQNRYQPKTPDEYSVKNRSFVIGWIGSPTSYKYLEVLKEPIRMMAAHYPLVLRVLGPPNLPGWDGFPVEFIPWRETEEQSWLRSFDIGVMPLTNDSFARGKSGFKLIQYMATGVPCVASDIGCNSFILDGGRAGVLVKSDREWVEALSHLIVNENSRRSLGMAGHKRFLGEFILEVLTERRLSFFSEIIDDKC